MTVTLRHYQLRAIEQCREAIRQGRRAPLIVSPTGSGKTTIGAAIVRGHLERTAGGRCLWLAHRAELVSQAADRLRHLGYDAGVISASADYSGSSPVIVASVQTLRARGVAPPASLVVFDEAHHYAADDWGELAGSYADSVRVGLTATPERSDGRGLSPLFDALVVATSIRELTAEKHLVPLEVLSPGRTLRANELAQSVTTAYAAHARGERAVVFCSGVTHAHETVAELRAAGFLADPIIGAMGALERRDVLARHAATGSVLVNVGVLTEGWDSPATSCAILARGCGSQGMLIQIAGRVLRPAAGKKRALLIDLRGVTEALGRPDEDRLYSLTGKAIRRADEQQERYCLVCGAELPPDAFVCDECGHESGAAARPLKIVGCALVKYASKRRETDEQRAATMARWMREGFARKFKAGFAFGRYRAVYGVAPSAAIVELAKAILKEKAA